MKRRLSTLAIVALALAGPLLAGPAYAQRPPEAPPDVATEVAALRHSVDRLITMFEGFLADQQLVLMMKRIELASDQLAPIQQELYKVRANREAAEEEIARLEAMKRHFDARQAEEEGLINERESRDMRMMREQYDQQVKTVQDRLFSLQQQELTLEGEMKSRREKIEMLEDLVDREIGLR